MRCSTTGSIVDFILRILCNFFRGDNSVDFAFCWLVYYCWILNFPMCCWCLSSSIYFRCSPYFWRCCCDINYWYLLADSFIYATCYCYYVYLYSFRLYLIADWTSYFLISYNSASRTLLSLISYFPSDYYIAFSII
jgi:hypothetical protein